MITAVFIEPSPMLATVLDAGKSIVRARWPRTAYLDHPPHATLIAGAFSHADRWLPALADALHTERPFAIETQGTMVFANDPMTGGSTVAIAIAESTPLRRLQLIIAGVLAPSRNASAAEALAQAINDPVAAQSARAFGSAWVGAHWRPHFTIASLPVSESDIPAALTQAVPPITVRVDAVSIWHVDGEAHTRIAAVPLGDPGPSTT